MHLLNRPHPDAHDFTDSLLVGAGRFGQPLLGAAALLGIILMMQDIHKAHALTAGAVVSVVAWLALQFARRRG